MTGGTSLAVWMGGAATELYRMLRSEAEPSNDTAGLDIYRGLLELTETSAVIDVVTGTSAGGLNGSMIAAAWVLGVTADEYLSTRATWLKVANLQALMRKPGEPEPPSLLLGDDYFVPQLKKHYDDWATLHPDAAKAQDAPAIDVLATVTAVNGVPTTRTDDFNEDMNEVTQAHHLHFGNGDFADPNWSVKFSIATRTSASIPGVFEPSFIPCSDTDASTAGRPSFKYNASFGASRWCVDGGVTVNLPLKEALQRIFDQTAAGEVRRVVLFISPTPASKEQLSADPADAPPTLLRSLGTIPLAPRSHGISGDIDDLETVNAAVDRQRRMREAIAAAAQSVLGAVVDSTFNVYCQRRAETSVAATLDAVQRDSGRRLQHRARLAKALVDARLPLLPTSPQESDGDWRWGIAPVEQAISIAVDVLQRAFGFIQNPTAADNDAWRSALATSKAAVHAARARLALIRRHDEEFWKTRIGSYNASFSDDELAIWATESYAVWPFPRASNPATEAKLQVARDAAFTTLAQAHRDVAKALVAAAPTLVAVASRAGDAPFANLVAAIGIPAGSVDDVVEQLLRFHVASAVLLGDVVNREQRVDLMQLSWNSYNGIDNRRPEDKLAGNELGRLGAFLKPSWRANDWFWGRMDAAYRLVVLLLDPRRLKQLGVTPDQVRAFLGGAEVGAELEVLNPTWTQPIPASLPKTAQAIARRIQTAIAQEELPLVAAAVKLSNDDGGVEGDHGALRSAVDEVLKKNGGVVPADEVPDLVKKMRIGSESVGQELGYGLMNKVMARGAAVGVNMVAAPNSGMIGVGRVARALRAPLQAINSLVSLLTGTSPAKRTLAAFVLAAAGAIVALRAVGADVPAGTFAIATTLLFGIVVMALLRSRLISTAIMLALPAAVVTLTLLGNDLRPLVYSTAEQPAPITLKNGGTLHVPAGSVLHVTDGDRRNDVAAEAATDVLVDGTASVSRAPTVETGDAGWKRWGFFNRVSMFAVAAGLFSLIALIATVRSKPTNRQLGLLLVSMAGAVATWEHTPFWRSVLTGTSPEGDHRDGFKLIVVKAAEGLGSYKLEVVLLTLIATTMAIGFGADVLISRVVRRRT
ncbi:MAG: hypothetical protein QOK28_3366 [Actinomycetota bacterium]|jgi:patatin-related protein